MDKEWKNKTKQEKHAKGNVKHGNRKQTLSPSTANRMKNGRPSSNWFLGFCY